MDVDDFSLGLHGIELNETTEPMDGEPLTETELTELALSSEKAKTDEDAMGVGEVPSSEPASERVVVKRYAAKPVKPAPPNPIASPEAYCGRALGNLGYYVLRLNPGS